MVRRIVFGGTSWTSALKLRFERGLGILEPRGGDWKRDEQTKCLI